MKIIEALKELPLIDKKIEKNSALIQKYAAVVDNGKMSLSFDTEEQQRKTVVALVQANNDLVARRAKIRQLLSITNAKVNVTIGDMTKSISEWIEYRQFGIDRLTKTYSALSDQQAAMEVSRTQFTPTTGIRIVRMFDESEKNDNINKLMDVKNSIDTTLETVNATTDVVEE